MAKKIKKSSESKLPKDYDLFIHLLMTLSYSIYITGKLSNFTEEKIKERKEQKKAGKKNYLKS